MEARQGGEGAFATRFSKCRCYLSLAGAAAIWMTVRSAGVIPGLPSRYWSNLPSPVPSPQGERKSAAAAAAILLPSGRRTGSGGTCRHGKWRKALAGDRYKCRRVLRSRIGRERSFGVTGGKARTLGELRENKGLKADFRWTAKCLLRLSRAIAAQPASC
jgi:hypothetical protein